MDLEFLSGHRGAGRVDHAVVGDDVEGRPVPSAGFGVPPVPEGSEDSGLAGCELAAAVDAPGIFQITFARFAGVLHHGVAGLAIPLPPAEFFELVFEDFGQRKEVADVVERVFFHAWRQGSPSPVGAL